MKEWTSFHEYHESKIELVAGIDCWIWTGCTHPKGHGRVSSNSGHNYAHRAAYAACKGNIPDGAMILHKCGNASCVRPSHLSPGGAAQNGKDMADMGRSPRSISHSKVRGIRADYDDGMPLGDIAKKYGIAYGSVYPIVCYQNYPHVDPEKKGKHKMRAPRKLSESDVREIKECLKSGVESQSVIAKKYNVAQSVISRINTGKRHKQYCSTSRAGSVERRIRPGHRMVGSGQ